MNECRHCGDIYTGSSTARCGHCYECRDGSVVDYGDDDDGDYEPPEPRGDAVTCTRCGEQRWDDDCKNDDDDCIFCHPRFPPCTHCGLKRQTQEKCTCFIVAVCVECKVEFEVPERLNEDGKCDDCKWPVGMAERRAGILAGEPEHTRQHKEWIKYRIADAFDHTKRLMAQKIQETNAKPSKECKRGCAIHPHKPTETK